MRLHVPDMKLPGELGSCKTPFNGEWHHPYSPLWLEKRNGGLLCIGIGETELLTIRGEIADKVFQLMMMQDFKVKPVPADRILQVPRNCFATAAWLLENRRDKDAESNFERTDSHIASENREFDFPFGIEWTNVATSLPTHGAVALGSTPDMDMVVFEKMDFNKPFNVGLFSKLNEHYTRGYSSTNGRVTIVEGAHKPLYYPNHL